MKPASRLGDNLLHGLCLAASALAVAVLVAVAYQITHGAQPALNRFGLAFLGHDAWAPNFDRLGAAVPLYGTAVTSVMALLIAGPMGVMIAIFLAMLAPRRLRAVAGPMVEMLAAIPSVIVGFWGVLVLAPFVHLHLEPWLHRTLGFLGIFGTPQTTGLSLFTAGLVLALMILPIIASLSRDLFLTVPRELKEGAEALGATRWEVIRGVVLPSTAAGVAAAVVLALGRALGEAIAVLQVVGGGAGIHGSLFQTGYTLAARVANDFQSIQDPTHLAGLYYLALVLLVIGVASNLLSQAIARRFDLNKALTGR